MQGDFVDIAYTQERVCYILVMALVALPIVTTQINVIKG